MWFNLMTLRLPQVSGLSADIGALLGRLNNIPVWLLVFVLTLITATLTEVTTNVTTTTIFLPIVANLVRRAVLYGTDF